MRRGVGIGALQADKLRQQKFKEKGEDVNNMQVSQMKERLDIFRQSLEEFAIKHKKDINKNAEFRHQFQQMCSKIGVDPLASNKGFWAELLGVGDFYYELGIQIIEICLKTRNQNGGLIELNELTERVQKTRNKYSQKDYEITTDDIKRSIKHLKVLGNGFQLVMVGGGRYFVQSVPCEMNADQTSILSSVLAKKALEGMTVSDFERELMWSKERVVSALRPLIMEGFAWIDTQSPKGEDEYWFPGLISQ
ncbi:predicted protein [Naegleria gruberi]|uniref:Predicted protein n=1 Tax=Naegleria gruberi TaxID=5762 RepID=D2VZ30_NAEGR|nr:uncharacterized protein NAEGRDRAFT_53399 [Naegleria gruberi]EFC37873.1 predicted protein [Naegleria gruberi]|eukprot:XP_002670617.1 predicted protein [Naegleria gruberi strain NEG-M]